MRSLWLRLCLSSNIRKRFVTREVHYQTSTTYGKGYGASVQRSLLCILQTSPYVWFHTSFGFFLRRSNIMIWTWSLKCSWKSCKCLFILMCLRNRSSPSLNNGMILMFQERQRNFPSKVFQTFSLIGDSTRPPSNIRFGKHL
jgi:hypothetical protein